MEFASKYVYSSTKDEFEYVSDEEYDKGMQVSDSDSDDDNVLCSKAEPVNVNDAGDVPSGMPPLPPPPPHMTPPKPPGKRSKTAAFSWQLAINSGENKEEYNIPPRQSSNAKKFRRADTNIISIKLNKLVAASNMHAGDPVFCSKCQSILSKIAKIVSDGPDKIWSCDFCGERNLVDIEEEEIPGSDDVTFLVEPALATTATGPSGIDDSLVIFCVDVSGSMCVTTEVPGQLRLRGTGGLRRMQSLNDTHEDQFMPRQRRDVTYVSRLQAMQAAVDHQLGEMQRDYSTRRVGLVTFDNEVTVIGDGTVGVTSFAGDKLTNKETLFQLGAELELPKPIKETRKHLGDKLFELEEGGATALGPALVIAVSMASRHPGSKVIVCTDGMANVGMGKLDQATDAVTEDFYDNIGTIAMEKGVTISVVTIKGTDCKLVELGKLADKTGGQVNIVNPLKLTQEFSTILADRTIATNVEATLNVHKLMYIQNVNNDIKESREVREVGNVTSDTEITFEYCMRQHTQDTPAKDKLETDAEPEMGASTSTGGGDTRPERSAGVPDELPFQLQVRYTDTEGMKALRVLTQMRPVTSDRNLAESNVNLDVLGTHAAQKTANLALQGEYTQSRGVALMNQRLAWRSAHSEDGLMQKSAMYEGGPLGTNKKAWYRRIFSKIQTVDNHVTRAQSDERSRRGTTYSDEEDEDEEEQEEDGCPKERCKSIAVTDGSRRKQKKSKSRMDEATDEFANAVYAQSKISANKLN